MVYHGKGYTFTELYNMPIPMRMFHLDKMKIARDKENKELEKMNKR
jgi:hypothetical protein|tara:strand:- start:3018 stop:3155 length:138 start_codon:yes stop_codon:yes gene_type:complete